jgi:hypothetical protein
MRGKKRRLPARQQPPKPLGGGGDHKALADIGIAVDLVGVCVMGVVLGNPPAETQSTAGIALAGAKPIAGVYRTDK